MPLTKVNGQMLDGAITADSSGNVGIGTSSPGSKLHVEGANVVSTVKASSGYAAQILNAATSNVSLIGFQANAVDQARIIGDTSTLQFCTGSSNTERMRIDSSGRVTMPYQPAFRAFTGTTFTGSTVVIFNNTQFNTGGHYSTSTGRFTAPIAGTYFFTFYLLSATGYSGAFWGGLRRNATSIAFAEIDWPGNFRTITTSTVVQLSAGDYVDVLIAAGDTYAGGGSVGEWNAFSGYLIG